MKSASFGQRLSCKSYWRWSFLIATCVVSGGLSACGAPGSDPASGLDPRAATGKTANTSEAGEAALGAKGKGQASGVRVSMGPERSGENGRTSADQAAISDRTDGTADEGNAVLSPNIRETSFNIPETVARSLGSPDARERYRALDYWETQGAQAPLDAVFEALDDDDAAIRAKAASIVEQHMDLEKEQD